MNLSRREMLAALGMIGAACSGRRLIARPVLQGRNTLSHARASGRAKALYAYLWTIYGKKTLTGQQESSWTAAGPRAELDFIEHTSGKLPAILGLDYLWPEDNQNLNQRAAQWYLQEGGVPTICWHWGVPGIGSGYENSKKDFDVSAALRSGTVQHRDMMHDLDVTAGLLAELRDLGVPVLWRPFHEFSGNWFWWGKHGPEAFKALWTLMYDHFTNQRKLDNLIWVLGYAGQNIDPSYYPGRRMVDIAGADLYVQDHGNLSQLFHAMKQIVGNSVPICLHENGPIPAPETLGPDADWLYFLTWHTHFIMDGVTNPPTDIRAAYNAARYVTKDELPALR